MKKLLIVTGMHRSGTSALTRVCNLLGFDLGEELVNPQPNDNETGFWEDKRVVEINEEILIRLGSSHLEVGFLPKDFSHNPVIEVAKTELENFIKTFTDSRDFPALKDPRIARLMPLWLEILGRLGIKPIFLIALRHPLEVAQSLNKRNNLPIEDGLALWAEYNQVAEYYTRKQSRAFVFYPELLGDWKSTTRHIAEGANLKWPLGVDIAASAISGFLKAELRHNKCKRGKDKMPGVLDRHFEILLHACRGEISTRSLDQIYEEYRLLVSPFQNQAPALISKIQGLEAEKAALQSHINALLSSNSWKVTAPLRSITNVIKGQS
jgi:hypothetical protein